jgi:hypothetical protein
MVSRAIGFVIAYRRAIYKRDDASVGNILITVYLIDNAMRGPQGMGLAVHAGEDVVS